MTAPAIARCSTIALQGFALCSLAMLPLINASIHRPQITLTKIAVESSNRNTGIRNVKAKKNFETKVQIVDSHISLSVCLFSASSDI